MRADGRTDMTELVVAFHSFVNAPKKNWSGPAAGNFFLKESDNLLCDACLAV